MWKKLGLDLPAHDALLAMLGEGYQATFLTQKNRPKAMEYFDFVMSEVHGLRIRELMDAKEQGRIVVGSYCVYVPEELILAVDGVSVGLCAGAEYGFDKAEQLLPANTCSLIKGAFGFALGKVCPYLSASDMVVGEATCDGKKKAYEILGDYVNNLYVMDMPQKKTDDGRTLLKAEYRKFAGQLESLSGKKITAENLRRAIGVVNEKRKAMHRLAKLRAADPTPISGLDALLVSQVFFYDDPIRFTGSVNKLCDELEVRIESKMGVFPKGTPRIVVSGCPMAVPNWKLPTIIEASGAVVVGEESCVGERGTQYLVENSEGTVDAILDSIVDRYFKIDCAIFTPNSTRLEHIRKMAKEYSADGVVHYNLQFCGPYQIESGPVVQSLQDGGMPTLRLDTDYSMGDKEQIRTRIEALIEQIKGV